MKKYVCPVCGYVHEGELPEGFVCPVCKVPGSKFKVMEEGKLAAEHELGIYEKTVANNPDISAEDKAYILEQLKANFNETIALMVRNLPRVDSAMASELNPYAVLLFKNIVCDKAGFDALMARVAGKETK